MPREGAAAPQLSAPPSPNSNLPTSPSQYANAISAIHRRTAARSASSLDDAVPASYHHPQSSDHGASTLRTLESDLMLAAQIGTALLEHKKELERKVDTLEKSNRQLLDRLTTEVKANNQLQRRLEEAKGDLELSDSNNRAMLVSLEEGRKNLARLTVEYGRLVSTTEQLKSLSRAYEDLKQELLVEEKARKGAESRLGKQEERNEELKERLSKVTSDLEAMRDDRVLRKENEVLAQLKASASLSGLNGIAENGELLKMVQDLATENDTLRAETVMLHEMLAASRDDHVRRIESNSHEFDGPLSSPMNRRRTDSDHRPADNLLSQILTSPSTSHSLAHLSHRPPSPSSMHSRSDRRRSWNPSASVDARVREPSRAFSTGSTVSNGEDEPSDKPVQRRVGVNSGIVTFSGKVVPIGRRNSRRASSIDAISFPHIGAETSETGSVRFPSPSPPSRAGSLLSDTDDPYRARRRHRPLSLSMGSSIFARVPEDLPSPSFISPSRPPHHSVPTPESSPIPPPSGLTRTSPKKKASDPPMGSLPPLPTLQLVEPSILTPRQHTLPRRSASDPDSPSMPSIITHSSTYTSELSEHDRENTSLDSTLPSNTESRTAALGTLIEHTAKLLARLQAADVASQENRLKKQHLPGDVRHVSQSNLKDLVVDIEGMRSYFRKFLEKERNAASKDTSIHLETSDSLVARRDFIELVKLLRNLLFETSRLRALVNRVELDPLSAPEIREIDQINYIDTDTLKKSVANASGLLAPLSRLFVSALSLEPSRPVQPSMAPAQSTKLAGSSAVSSATVSVEFGNGIARRSRAEDWGAQELPKPVVDTPSLRLPSKATPQTRRDLNSIFAGAQSKPAPDAWVVLPRGRVVSSNPFGRLLSSSRPPLSPTTNAMIDSLPHARQPDAPYEPTLLERQLRPRGLSDSSIRSTFIAHANPQHRVITAATLALSSETARVEDHPVPIIIASSSSTNADDSLKHQLSTSLSRKPSIGLLRGKASSSQLRSVSNPVPHKNRETPPPVPALPISISISPSPPVPVLTSRTMVKPSPSPSTRNLSASAGAGESFFGSFSTWASGKAPPAVRSTPVVDYANEEIEVVAGSDRRTGEGLLE